MVQEDFDVKATKCMKLHEKLIEAMESEKNVECQLLVLIEMVKQVIDFVKDQVPDIEEQIISEIKRRSEDEDV